MQQDHTIVRNQELYRPDELSWNLQDFMIFQISSRKESRCLSHPD